MNKVLSATFCLLLNILLLTGAPMLPSVNSQPTLGTCPSKPFRMTLVSTPDSLNFLTLTTGSSSGTILDMEYSGPLGFDLPNGNHESSSSMADWVSSNSNYTVWMIHAKPGAVWSNGQPVTADDFLATFGPNFGLNATFDFAGLHTEVKREYALNSSTAVFELNAPDAQWMQKLGPGYYTVTMPAAFVNSQGVEGANFGTNIAFGPFYVSNYTAGMFSMKMYRNPYFTPLPYICEIDLNFVDSLSQTSTYLQSGTTDFSYVDYSNAKAILAANPNLKIYSEKGLGTTSIQYNDTVFPYNLTEFRQALAWSVNQDQIVQSAFAGYALTAYDGQGTVSPTASSLYNPNVDKYGYDPNKALALLQSVDITKGTDGFLHYANGTVVSLDLWADTNISADPVAASIVASNLESLGMKINLHTTTSGSIAGNYGSNVQGIRNAMILSTSYVGDAGNAYIDSLPAWDVYWIPTVPNSVWLWPSYANDQWMSNETAFANTADPQLGTHYLFNVEALNAKYLPTLIVAYPDRLLAFNQQYYDNYSSGRMMYYLHFWNWTALAEIQPTAANPLVGTTSSSSSTTTSSTQSSDTTTYALAALVIVVVAVAVIAQARRKKRAT